MPKTALASSGSIRETQWTGSRALSVALALICGLVLARLIFGFFWDVPLSIDEAQYTVWSRELQAGYFSKPPVIAWAIAASSGLCGDESATCVRMLQPLALAGAALGVMATAWQLWQSRAIALWAGVLFLSLPLVSFYSQIATTDGWFLFWWSWSLWALSFSLGLGFGRSKDGLEELGWVMVGVFAGLGLMTKYSMGVFVITALLGLVIARRLFIVGPVLGAFVALLIVAPNLFWNAEWGYPTLAHHAEISRIGQDTGIHIGRLFSFWLSQFLVMGPLVLASLFVFSSQMVMRWTLKLPWVRDTGLLFSLAAIWPFFAVISLQSLTGKVEANWAAPASVGLSLLAARLWCCAPVSMFGQNALQRLLSKTWLPASLCIHLPFAALVLLMPWGLERFDMAGRPDSDPRLKFQQLEDLAKAVGPELSRIPKLGPANTAAQVDSGKALEVSAQGASVVIASDDRHFLAYLDHHLGGETQKSAHDDILKDQGLLEFNGVWYLPKNLGDTSLPRHHWSLQKDLRSKQGSWLVLYITKSDGDAPQAHDRPVLSPSNAQFNKNSVALTRVLPASQTLNDWLSKLQRVEEPGRAVEAYWLGLEVHPSTAAPSSAVAPSTAAPSTDARPLESDPRPKAGVPEQTSQDPAPQTPPKL